LKNKVPNLHIYFLCLRAFERKGFRPKLTPPIAIFFPFFSKRFRNLFDSNCSFFSFIFAFSFFRTSNLIRCCLIFFCRSRTDCRTPPARPVLFLYFFSFLFRLCFVAGVTILLSLTVFHNIVTETLPQVSDAMPLLGIWSPLQQQQQQLCTQNIVKWVRVTIRS